MKNRKKDRLFGRTDYMVKEVNLLTVFGAIPSEFVTFHPDRGIEIDYIVTSFMEYFPRKTLGGHWIEVFFNTIRYACDLIKLDVATPEHIRQSAHGETEASFSDTTRLSGLFGMSKSKLDSLLGWALKQNPDLLGFVMYHPEAGFVVSAYMVAQLKKVGVRLDQFLKKIVSGSIRFEVK